jgi:4a-hydroxytetrahydrobiopterin dehydratase
MKKFEQHNNQLYASFQFKNFIEAMDFINKVAIIAEKQHHHPTIHNTYNKVELFLSTHDEGNIVTKKDEELAEAIMELVS